ncbi:MAG: glycosyltransferase family 2 protein [Acidobacteria bacterium]|nr:glycosyltransferase family 2 protein [Acidobacteriota bacterium]
MSLSIVIPVYNSERSLPLLVERVEAVFHPRPENFEIVFVNDGSRDGSWGVIRSLVAAHPWIRGINLMRNCGQHNALLCGIRAARHAVIVTMDDDLQNPPEEIPKLLARLNEGFDVVYGTPRQETHGLLRDLASKITKVTLQKAMGSEAVRHISAFRAFHTCLRDAFAQYRGSFVSIDVLLTWATTRFTYVVVRNDPRTIGVSNYTVRKLIVHAINMMTGFSTLPLEIASILGFVFMGFGVCALVWVLGRWLLVGSVVPGFAFLGATLSIFSGVQMFALGIMGEYLARMHTRLTDHPPYCVREHLESTDAAPGLTQLNTAIRSAVGERGEQLSNSF